MGNRNKGIFFPFKTFLTLQIFYNDLKKKNQKSIHLSSLSVNPVLLVELM